MTQVTLEEDFQRLYQLSREHTTVPWEERERRLKTLEKFLRDNRKAIAAVIAEDFQHRSIDETMLLEVFPTLEGIRHALKHAKGWMKTRRVAAGLWFKPATCYLQPQPLGVVGVIVPWNYPLNLALGPVIAAFAAGNRVMMKMSEYTPRYGAWMEEHLGKYFTRDELVVVNGDAEVAARFSSLPFDHLLFTGSTAVGKLVMRAAAANLTPVTLELGGKSPTIVLDDADLPNAVARIMIGKLLNAGQTCIAPDYVWLPEGQVAAFVEEARAWVARHYPNPVANQDYTRIISERQLARLSGYLDEAAAQGSTVHYLAEKSTEAGSRALPPVIVTDPKATSGVLKDEIFGPILPILTYRHIDDALAYIRANPRPLALYVFGKDSDKIQHVLDNTVSGGVTVNDTIYHQPQENLPFGGIGASGMGAYHGKFGFDTFTHLKPIFRQAPLNGVGLLLPPYGGKFKLMLKLLLR